MPYSKVCVDGKKEQNKEQQKKGIMSCGKRLKEY